MLFLFILFQLIIFFILATVIALPLAACLFFFSKHKRKRKTIFGLTSPYVFVFSYYFVCLIGGYACSTIFKTGCAMDEYWHTELPNGYGITSTENDFIGSVLTGNLYGDRHSINGVTQIKISGDTIFGERHDGGKDLESKHYFYIDTETGELVNFNSLNDAQNFNPDIPESMTSVESFYYDSWVWVTPLGVLAFLVSSSLVFIMWWLIVRINLSRRKRVLKN